MSRRICEHNVYDGAAVLRMGAQELAVCVQSPNDVLRQLGAVDANNDTTVADASQQCFSSGVNVGLRRTRLKFIAVDSECVHMYAGRSAVDMDCCPAGVGAEQAHAASDERLGPAWREKTDGVRAEHAEQNLPGNRVGQQAE